jgi:hypothetical protein
MTRARFPDLAPGRGHYESFFLRAVDPVRPRAMWIRHTVHQAAASMGAGGAAASPTGAPADRPPAASPTAAVWCTVFEDGRPFAVKQSGLTPVVPRGGWIGAGVSTMGPDGACGAATAGGRRASWELSVAGSGPPLEHLTPAWLYRAPLPRTKLESPQPDAVISGHVEVDGRRLEVAGWPGMTGHNWGTEHAARWVWLHGTAFADVPDAWLDIALARVRVGGILTPWVANGAIGLAGTRHRVGGLHRPARVRARPGSLDAELRGPGPIRVRVTSSAARHRTVAFTYADPSGGAHETLNSSLAALRVRLERPGRPPVELATAHGGVYELGLPAGSEHGVALEPFPDP